MQPKLIIDFETLSEPDFFAKAQLINNSMAANANFPAPWQVAGVNLPTVIASAS